jgi:hypothetical protein
MRTQYELQNIRHQVDQAKLRLTTDIKVKKKRDFIYFIFYLFIYSSYEIKLKMNAEH